MVAIEREWVGLPSPTARVAGHGSHPCQGIYHRAPGATPRVACIATHYSVDFAEHYLAPYLAERETLPGERYFETGGRDQVADLVAGWVTDRT
ncbi:MAG: hypothetical protein U5K30_11565 [Acidimicrobiales bacterium]|nr:hypothetical protein [Acidimicrobiales bacterium]